MSSLAGYDGFAGRFGSRAIVWRPQCKGYSNPQTRLKNVYFSCQRYKMRVW